MKITILCSDASHPVNGWLEQWAVDNGDCHTIEIIRSKHEISRGDILFLISCDEIINARNRMNYRKSLVIHASDLPSGRGWSPHIWQIVEGAQAIAVTLLEAEDKVDSGKIWKKLKVAISETWLHEEINRALFDAELELMDHAVARFDSITPIEQDAEIKPTYYPKRTVENSRVDPNCSIADQFDLIRVCDPLRFPAFFELRGQKYRLIVEKY